MMMIFIRPIINQTEGFFVECGAYDGQTLSNSLYLERSLNWSGILAEPSPPYFKQLESRNRKAWAMPVCLSLEPYPTVVGISSYYCFNSM